jgi:hypothetical protein
MARRRGKEISEADVLELYAQKKSDAEIAVLLHCCAQTVAHRRKLNGLPAWSLMVLRKEKERAMIGMGGEGI